MNLGLVSLLLLIAAIIIGFVRNCNVGILCTAFAMILGIIYGVNVKDILAGFSSSLFIQMVGITYLFAIINGNGTLELLARKMVGLVGKKKHLIPFVMYILGFLICAVGPGAIPSLAIVPVIAIPVAVSAGVNPIMTAIIGDLGVMSGRMSPLTPEAAVVRELMEEQYPSSESASAKSETQSACTAFRGEVSADAATVEIGMETANKQTALQNAKIPLYGNFIKQPFLFSYNCPKIEELFFCILSIVP